jgi:hypothetical protein
VQEQNMSGLTTCTTRAFTGTGTLVASVDDTSNGSGSQTLDMPFTFSGGSTANKYHYLLSCWLSAASALQEYEIEER